MHNGAHNTRTTTRKHAQRHKQRPSTHLRQHHHLHKAPRADDGAEREARRPARHREHATGDVGRDVADGEQRDARDARPHAGELRDDRDVRAEVHHRRVHEDEQHHRQEYKREHEQEGHCRARAAGLHIAVVEHMPWDAVLVGTVARRFALLLHREGRDLIAFDFDVRRNVRRVAAVAGGVAARVRPARARACRRRQQQQRRRACTGWRAHGDVCLSLPRDLCCRVESSTDQRQQGSACSGARRIASASAARNGFSAGLPCFATRDGAPSSWPVSRNGRSSEYSDAWLSGESVGRGLLCLQQSKPAALYLRHHFL
mmetsp:Transcript_8020/g.24185  ORF Transcript_8020/g.24185 Transcript_8020/m.24185 type:complete len:315 (-) Transcript_8020:137-1081(-)